MTFVTAALLLLLAQGDVPQGRTRSLGCKTACESHVRSSQLRATVCNRCFMGALGVDDRGAWVLALGTHEGAAPAVASALSDPDWEVRWGAVRANSRGKASHELSALASWILKAEGADGLRARLTAVHLGGKRKLSTALLLKAAGADGPAAAVKVWNDRASLRKQLEVELFGTDPQLQQEALSHLAVFLRIPEGRVVLESMREKPAGTDTIAAEILRARAAAGGLPAGLALLQGAEAEHKPFVDRLFAVYSRQIEALRPDLASPELSVRKNAIRELWNLGPLAGFDLEKMLGDEVAAVRLSAARAVAAGEGRTLAESAKARLGADSKVSPALQARWIDALGESGSKGCSATLSAIANDNSFGEQARGAAVKALGACGGAESFEEISRALGDSSPAVRAGAVLALGYMPRNSKAEAAAAKALEDKDPVVIAAAARTVGMQRQAAQLAPVQALLDHQEPLVRVAAVEASAALGGSKVATAIGRALRTDSDPLVRVAAAKALGDLGGPHAPGPLGEAAKRDSDGRVQHVALESLRRLGYR